MSIFWELPTKLQIHSNIFVALLQSSHNSLLKLCLFSPDRIGVTESRLLAQLLSLDQKFYLTEIKFFLMDSSKLPFGSLATLKMIWWNSKGHCPLEEPFVPKPHLPGFYCDVSSVFLISHRFPHDGVYSLWSAPVLFSASNETLVMLDKKTIILTEHRKCLYKPQSLFLDVFVCCNLLLFMLLLASSFLTSVGKNSLYRSFCFLLPLKQTSSAGLCQVALRPVSLSAGKLLLLKFQW